MKQARRLLLSGISRKQKVYARTQKPPFFPLHSSRLINLARVCLPLPPGHTLSQHLLAQAQVRSPRPYAHLRKTRELWGAGPTTTARLGPARPLWSTPRNQGRGAPSHPLSSRRPSERRFYNPQEQQRQKKKLPKASRTYISYPPVDIV